MKLHDIGTIHSGYTFRASLQDIPEGDIAVVQAKDLDVDFGISELHRITLVSKGGYYLYEGDVLISARGWPKAAVYHSPAADIKAVAASSVFILRLKSGFESYAEFLAYYLNTSEGIREYRKRSYGASMQSIAKNDLGDIPVPNLKAEQIAQLSGFAYAKKQYQTKKSMYEHYLDALEASVTSKLFKETTR